MKDRFDLENEINFFHTFGENLKTVSEAVLEDNLDRDDIVNAIEGIRVLLEIHTNKVFDTMAQSFKLDQYNDK